METKTQLDDLAPTADLGGGAKTSASGRRWECRTANPFIDNIDDYGLFSVKPFAIGQTVGELIYAEDAIASRIAACLNACDGASTENLEDGTAIVIVKNQRSA